MQEIDPERRSPGRDKIEAVDQWGRAMHVPMDRIGGSYSDTKGTLTSSQEDRLLRVWNILSDVLGRRGHEYEKWRENTLFDSAIEHTICIQEAIAEVFDREQKERSNSSLADRRLLLLAINEAVGATDDRELLITYPKLKAVRKLPQLITRVHEAMQRRILKSVR